MKKYKRTEATLPDAVAPVRPYPPLGSILLRNGSITEDQLLDALREQKRCSAGRRVGEILADGEAITETDLARALSDQLGLSMQTLARYQPMPEAIRSIPRRVAKRLRLIPLSVLENGLLLVAMVDPLDLLAQDEVRMLSGRDLRLCITTAAEITDNLDRLYGLQDNLDNAIVTMSSIEPLREHFREIGADEAPVVQLVDRILSQAVREGASDIHVEPCRKSARIRYRVDGVLYPAFDYPLMLHPAVSSRMKVMAGMDIAERRKPQDGRILLKVAGRFVDLRVSSLPTTRGEKMALRILDPESSPLGLEHLGLEPDDMEKVRQFCGTSWGILLVTGPTGSGKSTTLHSILEKINQPGINIVTVEDPVEYSLDGVSQVHVNEKAGLTFESALCSILRQDPDKIMIGEIRDHKTAQIATRAALTGHFVFSTLHTNDAPGAVTRMVDMEIPPYLVSASLSGVIAQRLVRKLCPLCREQYEMEPRMCEVLELSPGTNAWRAVGCHECRQGYKGRVAIYEVMTLDDALRRMILNGVDDILLRAEATRRGMNTLRQSGVGKALKGVTSMEEVLAVTLRV
ncbi:MAG: GspE/PulE family protein [Synergistaceae bacterium]|jgi:type IV pilus assembly protein PilB|nr:GspE/PulE family protein [Synergistaceae bacterium]